MPARVHSERDGRIGTIVARCPEPLIRELAASGTLDVERCVRITRGACAGVDAMADFGLAPRDLTPDKIFAHPERGGLLADSGLSLELVPGAPMAEDAHLSYRSPEELDGGERDERSLVYSLGAVLFACLVGRDPFGGSWSSVYLAHTTAPRPSARAHRSDVPAELDAVIARAMAVNPADRYATVRDFGTAAAVAAGLEEPVAVEQPEAHAPQEAAPAPAPAPAPALAPAPPKPASTGAKPAPARPKPAPARPKPAPARPKPQRAASLNGSGNGRGPEREKDSRGSGKPPRPPERTNSRPPERTKSRPPERSKSRPPERSKSRPPERTKSRPPERSKPQPHNGNGAAPRETDPVAGTTVTEVRPAGSILPAVRRDRVERKLKPLSPRVRAHASTQERRRRGSSARAGEAPARALRRPSSEQMERTGRLMVTAAVGLIALLSVLAAVGADDSEGRTRRVEAGRLSATLPAGWHAIDGGSGLTARSGDGDTKLVARVMPGPLDADNMLAGALQGSGSPEAAKLGALEVQRYGNLAGRAEAYVVHTTAESVLIVCRTRAAGLRACAGAAATVRLRGANPISLDTASARFARALSAFRGLGAARLHARARIADAPVAAEQESAAKGLARRYLEAAEELESSGLVGSRVANLDAALRANGAAYDGLGTAIAAGDARGYDAAREAVMAAEPAVTESSSLLFR